MYVNIVLKNLINNTKRIRLKHSWSLPQGFKTGIKVYNCISKQKEPLVLKNKDIITWYTCGPTVYDSSHIGHASCYVKLDIIQRILRNYFKYNLVSAINITDIDDKIIRRAIELNVDYKQVTEKYETEFWTDLTNLGIQQPDIVLRVSENIELIVDFIKTLIDNQQAYKSVDDSVYFSVNTSNYGKLQNINIQDDNKRPTSVKKSGLDFALWKSVKQEGEPFWESPWGKGRPGWHIECSALASNIFGRNVDIHAGGIDLRFPHHENEEAQCCAYHSTQQWVNYWFHTGHLQLNQSEKMSKSLKNTISIQEMLKKISADDFRMACLMSSYQNNMEYSEKLMDTAKNNYETIKNFIASCNEYNKGYLKASINTDVLNNLLNQSVESAHNAFCDNFDTPSVIKSLNKLISSTNSMLHSSASSNERTGLVSVLAIRNFVLNFLEVVGFNLNNSLNTSKDFSQIVDVLNEFRQEVRILGLQEKNGHLLQLCDKVRDNGTKCGIKFKDHGKISSWST